jgi:N utilization substance protein A
VTLDDKTQTARVLVAEDQLSLAIGRKGQNVRLASKLTGWKIDLTSPERFARRNPIAETDLLTDNQRAWCVEQGLTTFEDLFKLPEPTRAEFPDEGIGGSAALKVKLMERFTSGSMEGGLTEE